MSAYMDALKESPCGKVTDSVAPAVAGTSIRHISVPLAPPSFRTTEPALAPSDMTVTVQTFPFEAETTPPLVSFLAKICSNTTYHRILWGDTPGKAGTGETVPATEPQSVNGRRRSV